jgi:hypothetical protein
LLETTVFVTLKIRHPEEFFRKETTRIKRIKVRQKVAKSVSNASERAGSKLKKNAVVSVLKLNKNDKTVRFKPVCKMKINSIQSPFLNA